LAAFPTEALLPASEHGAPQEDLDGEEEKGHASQSGQWPWLGPSI
jgi:hypothetical protein